MFDHARADAWSRAGLRYYPKLVCAVPYTPVTGGRLLLSPDVADPERLREALLAEARELALELGASGVHWLFPAPDDHRFLAHQGLALRHDCQFHWRNRDYRDFDQFLAALTAKKRKNIRRERRLVREAGVRLHRFDGHSAGEREWRAFVTFYHRLFERKWGMATFNLGFFTEVGQRLPDNVLLVLAERGGDYIAGALMYRDGECLYGRHWGALEEVDSLHFETCYYQGIEYCIEQGLRVFEPGAQGEHKLVRGFLPVTTTSCHWVAAAGLREPVARICADERAAMADYIAQKAADSLYRVVESN